ncbi:MAG: PspC domain-containing protein [Bacteroidales bacterium]|nr:PspC domain-containing protein [Bacteroidales bacterium]
MKKTIKINISGQVFNIDEDAYDRLSIYLDKLHLRYNGTQGESEILADIESRITEIIHSRIDNDKQVISIDDVDAAIAILGEPEDFAEMEDGEEENSEAKSGERNGRKYYSGGRKRLYRDPDNQVVGGVCGGAGEYFGIDPVIIRVLFVIAVLLWGTGLLIYVLLWIAIPEAKTTAEKLEMKGERINVNNIEKAIRHEYEGVKENIKNIPNSQAYKRTRTGMSSFGRIVAHIFITFFKIIGIIIGASFILAGVALLIGIIGGVLAGQTWLMGDLMDWNEFNLSQVLGLFVDESVAILAIICVLLVIGLPILGLIYGGVKMLFPFRAHDRAIGFSSFGIWVFALILLAIFALTEGVKYNEVERVAENIELETPTNKLYFMVGQSDYQDADFVNLDFGYHRELRIAEDNRDLIILGMPVVDIVKSSNEQPELRIRKESRGVNDVAAERFAKRIQFGYTIRDSFLIIDPYFRLGEEEKWRSQELELVLSLPVGYRIFLDESAREYLSGVDNQDKIWSKRMVGQEWIMEENGLKRFSTNTD